MNNKRNSIASLFLSFCLISVSVFADLPKSKAITQEKQSSLTPQRALELLKEGNQRFKTNQMRDYNYSHEMKVTSTMGQHPLAIILNCIDSRSIADLLFDQGLGNLFVSRVAGNVVDKDILGGMEFATKVAGAPLILVMGHTHCGAVSGTCSSGANTGLENLDYLMGKIEPAVLSVRQDDKTFSCKDEATVDKIAKQNVINQLKEILANSSVISDLVANKSIYLVGAMHHIGTGEIEYFDSQGKAL